jgi:hypothetical protein
MTLEALNALFLKAQPARAGAWYVQSLFGDRAYATRSSDGAFGLFIRGELSEFGPIPRSGSVAHSTEVRIEPQGTVRPMLRIIAPAKAQGNRALTYLAYEACRLLEDNPSLPNEDLLRRLIWMLVLLEDDSVILSPERQRGLVGELQLLTRLVRRAKTTRRSAMFALERWHGASSAKRDFSGPGIAVEVKTTSDDNRIHMISSLNQLDPQDLTEDVFVYSLGVRQDYSAPRRLKHFISDIEVQLIDSERDVFHDRLSEYGYDLARPDLYDAEPGIAPFHLTPCFYSEKGLVRLRHNSFVGGSPPPPVLLISYRLMMTGESVPTFGEDVLLDRLLAIGE